MRHCGTKDLRHDSIADKDRHHHLLLLILSLFKEGQLIQNICITEEYTTCQFVKLQKNRNIGELRNDDFASSSSYIERTAGSQDNCITGTAGNTQLANLLNYKKPQHRGIAE